MRKNLLNCIFLFVLLVCSLVLVPKPASAQGCAYASCSGGCETVGQCINGYTCRLYAGNVLGPSTDRCGGGEGEAILGGVKVPVGVNQYSQGVDAENGTRIGIVNFITTMLRVFTIICGFWFMINIIYAGVLFITSSGDAAVFGKFKDSLFYSIIGLFVLAIAYMVAGLIGIIFFGDAGFIIRPTLFQAT